jgi:hypothetical protein
VALNWLFPYPLVTPQRIDGPEVEHGAHFLILHYPPTNRRGQVKEKESGRPSVEAAAARQWAALSHHEKEKQKEAEAARVAEAASHQLRPELEVRESWRESREVVERREESKRCCVCCCPLLRVALLHCPARYTRSLALLSLLSRPRSQRTHAPGPRAASSGSSFTPHTHARDQRVVHPLTLTRLTHPLLRMQMGWEYLIDSGALEELSLELLQHYFAEFGIKTMPATKLEAVVAIRQHNSASRSRVVWGSGDGSRS